MSYVPFCILLLSGIVPAAAASSPPPAAPTSSTLSLAKTFCVAQAATTPDQGVTPAPLSSLASPQTPAPSAPAAPQQPVAPAPPPPSITSAMVTMQIPDQEIDPKFLELANALPQVAVTINPLTLQSVLSGMTPAADSPLATKVRSAYLLVAPTEISDNEPRWKDGINPMVWVGHTKGGAVDWWRAYKSTPATQRPFPVEMFPFAYDFSTDTSTPAHVQARQFNNQGLDALFVDGDVNKSADLLFKSVTADPAYPYGPFNAGVLMMCAQDQNASLKMFKAFDDRRSAASPALQSVADGFNDDMKHLYFMLLSPGGQQRRIYNEDISAAWALLNMGQYRAAVLFAGQAAAVDPDGSRPEAQLIAALVCAEQNQQDKTVRWLQDALERTAEGPHKTVLALLRDVQTVGAGATTATTAGQTDATPPAPANTAPSAPAAPTAPAPAAPTTPAPAAPDSTAAPSTTPASTTPVTTPTTPSSPAAATPADTTPTTPAATPGTTTAPGQSTSTTGSRVLPSSGGSSTTAAVQGTVVA